LDSDRQLSATQPISSRAGDANVSVDAYGRDKREVAAWILNTTGAFALNKPLPARPGIVGAPGQGSGRMATVGCRV